MDFQTIILKLQKFWQAKTALWHSPMTSKRAQAQ